MGFRFRLALKVLLATGLLVAALYLGSSEVLLRGFGNVERIEAREDLRRLEEAMEVEFARLGDIVGDWAPWDDTYAFVEDRNEDYVRGNLLPNVLVNFDIDFMAWLNARDEIVHTYAGDRASGREAAAPTAFLERLAQDRTLLYHPDEVHIHAGVMLADRPLLVASAPIVRSDLSGPPRGSMIVGRYLDEAKIEQLETVTRLELAVHPLSEPLPDDVAAAYADLAGTGLAGAHVDLAGAGAGPAAAGSGPAGASLASVVVAGPNEIAGYLVIQDVVGEDALVLSARLPRPVFLQARRSQQLLLAVLIVGGLLASGVAYGLLVRLLASRRALHEANEVLEGRVRVRTLELERANEKLRHDAFHDALTGLPNRALFLDRLGRSLERCKRTPGASFAVLFLDTDRFKVINDSLGHAAGDELLVELAGRLVECVREVDTVARFGGDEFTVLLEDADGLEAAIEVAERMQRQVQRPFPIQGHDVHVSLSTGIVLSDLGYAHPDELLRDADIAMYRAKALGRANSQVFTLDLRERARSLMTMETELRTAIARDELRVYYQPIVSMESGRPVGVEALVRWHSPLLGEVAPSEFLPLAEEAGLIIDVDRWVLREACAQMARWRRRDPAMELGLSVNLSGQHFSRADMVEAVQAILTDTGFDARRLKLELTETTLLQPSPRLQAVMAALTATGAQLHIDDFGTGHSALSYLQSFPVRALKIDRSFIGRMTSSPESAQLIQTIVTMARTLGLEVTAEGIESPEQRDALRRLGCEYGQGFLFSRPVGAQELEAWLLRSPPSPG